MLCGVYLFTCYFVADYGYQMPYAVYPSQPGAPLPYAVDYVNPAAGKKRRCRVKNARPS